MHRKKIIIVTLLMALMLGGFAFNPTGHTTHMPDTVQHPVIAQPFTSPTLVPNATANVMSWLYGFTTASNELSAWTGPFTLSAGATYNGTVTFSYLSQVSFIMPYDSNYGDTNNLGTVYANLTTNGNTYTWSHAFNLFNPGHGPVEYCYIAPSWNVPHPSLHAMTVNVSMSAAASGYPWNHYPQSLITTPIQGHGVNETTNTAPASQGHVPYIWGYVGYYNVTFTESGLLGGTSWTVTLGGNPLSSTGTVITFSEPNGTYSFTVAGIAGYTANPNSGQLTVNGNTVNENIIWSQVKYTMTYDEHGLPANTQWFVNVTGQTSLTGITSSLTNSLPNGTYTLVVSSANNKYHVETYTSSFTVDGGGSTLNFYFTLTLYHITFSETGLPTNTLWTASVNNTNQTSEVGSIDFSEGNGSYNYVIYNVTGYAPSPHSGSLTVNGADIAVNIAFSPYYSIVFTESGLRTGTSWTVTISGQRVSSIANSLTFNRTNGSYSYVVSGAAGYIITPSTGQVTVSGSSITISLAFNKLLLLTFIESGLPSGQTWGVIFGGVYYKATVSGSAGTEIIINTTTGTQSATIYAVGSYYASPTAYNNYISTNTTILVTFTVAPANSLAVLMNFQFLLVILILGAIIAAAVVFTLWRRGAL